MPIRHLPPFLTTTDVAKLLGTSPRHISTQAKAGKLHGHHLPGARGDWRFLPEDLARNLSLSMDQLLAAWQRVDDEPVDDEQMHSKGTNVKGKRVS